MKLKKSTQTFGVCVVLSFCISFCSVNLCAKVRLKVKSKLHLSHTNVLAKDAILARRKHTDQKLFKERYAIISKLVSQYKRPVMIADFMPELGQIPFKLARDYGAYCIMVVPQSYDGPNNQARAQQLMVLKNQCFLQKNLSTIMLLSPVKSCECIGVLGTCEHIDIVLLHNLLALHNGTFGVWDGFLETLCSLGERTILEIPVNKINKKTKLTKKETDLMVLETYLKKQKAELLGTVGIKTDNPSHVYMIYSPKTTVKDCCFKDKHEHPDHQIYSDFFKKVFVKDGKERDWVPGINIMTFRCLDGLYPSRDLIFKKFEELAPVTPKGAEVIVQGDNLLVLPRS